MRVPLSGPDPSLVSPTHLAPAADLRTLLKFLALYRVLVGCFFTTLVAIGPTAFSLGEYAPGLFARVSVAYLIIAIVLLAVLGRVQALPRAQLTVHVAVDVVVTALLMYASGGFKSGLGVMLLISLAGAAMVADRVMTLFYAALATLAMLAEQAVWFLRADASSNGFLQPGLLSVGYFATALLVNRLAQRVLENEQVARERGVLLANQLRVNELVIQDVQDGVLVVDETLTVRQHNRQAAALMRAAGMDGTKLAIISPGLARRLSEWRTRGTASADPLKLDHSERRVRVRIQDAGVGTSIFALVFLEDLSRLEAEAQKVKLVALGRLTANIAHEIRNPLSAITHAADLIAEENRAEARDRLVRILRDNAQRLDRMVRDVLELTRRDRAQVERFALAAFVTTFIDEFAQYEKVPRAAFAVSVGDELQVLFDRVHLNQVLWNLVRNAWRHSKQGESSVTIRAERVGGQIELHVIDDGPGVPEALRGQLFEPFFTTLSRGTGLGLYIARELCAASDATLTFGSPASGGADFVIRWP